MTPLGLSSVKLGRSLHVSPNWCIGFQFAPGSYVGPVRLPHQYPTWYELSFVP